MPGWLKVGIALPAVAAPLAIFVFILWSEAAHREAQCPYATVEERELVAGVRVLEEARTCIDEVQERRFVVIRDGETRVLGRRRFAADQFAPDRYRWEARIEEDQVFVQVINEGHGRLIFREGTPSERAQLQ